MERNKQLILIVSSATAILLIVVFVITIGTKSKSADAPGTTSFSSPLTQSTDNLVVEYGGDGDSNTDATQTQYRFFGLDSLPLSQTVKSQLPTILPSYLREFLQPAFQYTYIHIVKSTIKQSSATAYSFDFYVDSPESYFHIEKTDEAGSAIGNPVTQIPWEGIK